MEIRDILDEAILYTREFDSFGCKEAQHRREARQAAVGCATFEEYLVYLKRIDPVFDVVKNGGAQ